MKSIFRYPGGKSKKAIKNWIMSFRPSDATSYREPFVGGGGIFFETSGKRWINDLNEGLIQVYLALRDRSSVFIKKCRSISPAKTDDKLTEPGKNGGQRKNKRLYDFFEYIKLNEKEDQALRYFYVNRTCYAGRVNYSIPSRLYFSNPSGWNIVNTDILEEAANHLVGVKITCKSYEDVLFEDGEKVWIYIDPPYVCNTSMKKTDQLYEHNFSLQQHLDLADKISRCRHKVAISYDNSDFVRELYRGFNIHENKWKYCGTSLAKKRIGSELLITNY